jgi:hypothetical protein
VQQKRFKFETERGLLLFVNCVTTFPLIWVLFHFFSSLKRSTLFRAWQVFFAKTLFSDLFQSKFESFNSLCDSEQWQKRVRFTLTAVFCQLGQEIFFSDFCKLKDSWIKVKVKYCTLKCRLVLFIRFIWTSFHESCW